MRIALCFSGQSRSFKKGFEYYKKHLLDYYNVDVFIHTWKGENVEEIEDLYKPKIMETSDPLVGNFDIVYTNTPDPLRHPPRFTVSMLYSVYQSSLIKQKYELENNFIYDWVIKTRTDFALNVKIPFNRLNNKKLYIPNCITVAERDFGNDQFAFSNSSIMDKRMSIYENIDKFYNEGCMLIGEHLLRKQIQLFKLGGENLIYVDVNHPFPPGVYNSTPHSLIRDDINEWK